MKERTTYTITVDDDPMVRKMIEQVMGIKSLSFLSGQSLLSRAERYEPIALVYSIGD